MAQALAHQDVILQLAEQERLKSKPPYAAFLYDKMAWRQWARRAEKRDLTFDLKSETHKIDKDLLEVVHQRLASVLQQAGIDGAARGSRDQSVLSQQLASAEVAQKKAEQAQKSLADAQRSILAKSAPLAVEPTQSQPSEQPTRRQIKTQKWRDKCPISHPAAGSQAAETLTTKCWRYFGVLRRCRDRSCAEFFFSELPPVYPTGAAAAA